MYGVELIQGTVEWSHADHTNHLLPGLHQTWGMKGFRCYGEGVQRGLPASNVRQPGSEELKGSEEEEEEEKWDVYCVGNDPART